MTGADWILRAEGIHRRFGAVVAADDVNVAVPRGAIYSLIGSNGAGKTTFVNMVTGYVKPERGRILFDGDDITLLDPRRIARLGIHRSFQIAQLCTGLTVLDNMLVAEAINADTPPGFFRLARSSAALSHAEATLERFGIAQFRDRRIAELPGGVKKLLDIAMAMAGRTELILLDEPTSGVAADEKFPIMDRVVEALTGRNVTILFVEHDMEIVLRYSQRVLAFYAGRIIANDAPEAVLSDPEVKRYVTGGGA
ncbi:MAG: ABC transporter ATP-binding protein [Burkholderiaceae bacterium]|nr:ABC transporter ATP-binding protein [Burkholderiaceae bacterium]